MFPISLTLIIVSLLLLPICVILYHRSYISIAKPHTPPSKPTVDTDKLPSFSIVVTTHDSDYMLKNAIDKLVSQQYPKFEIVIVNNASTDNTNDVITRATNEHPQLIRHTYLPQNRNGILHTAMATTLGVRASRNEWIILLKPNSTPKSSLWLMTIAQAIDHNTKLCIGYNDYYGYDNSKWVRKAISWRKKSQIKNYHAICRGKRKPIETENSNIALRKCDFFSNGGYGRWLYLKSFHENLYVTTFTKSSETKFLTSPTAQVETLLPPIETLWQTERRLIKKSLAKLSRSTKLRRCHRLMINLLYLFAVIMMIAGVAFSIFPLPGDNSQDYFNMVSATTLHQTIPLTTIIAALVFTILSLVHCIIVVWLDRRDAQRLYCPISNAPYTL